MRLFLSICFGVFLFILFFQPFPLENFNSNDRMIFIAGLAAIIFLFMLVVRLGLPWLFQRNKKGEKEYMMPTYLKGFIIFALSSVSYAFYLHFVGDVDISFYIMFHVAFICVIPPVILIIYDVFKGLKQHNEFLLKEFERVQKQLIQRDEEVLYQTIDFVSENSGENVSLPISDIVLFNSADNYVEILIKEGELFKKKMIRNTLKNIEQQIKPYHCFVRCHRICIVNLTFVEELRKDSSNNWLIIRGYGEQVPVSRQYLLKVKESI